MSNNPGTRIKGKGWFVNDYGVIYVQGSVEKKFYRKSTGMEHTPRNETYIKKNHREVLLQLVNKNKHEVSSDFATFGRSVVEEGVKQDGIKGGRGVQDQRDALSKFDRLILPYFKAYSLEDIKVLHIEKWQKSLLEKYSSSTVSKCRFLMKQIMHKACANDLVLKNPVEYAAKLEVVHEKQSAYSVQDALKMMKESKGFMHTWLNLAFCTGMRTGEMMGLMWDDIDEEYSCIYLQRSVTKGRMTIGSSGNKNHSRVVPLLPHVLKILLDAKKQAKSKWIFPSRKGTYYSESKAIIKAHFKPLLEELGIEYITLYATRHTFSSIADNAMVNAQALDAMMGNSEEVRDKHYNTFAMTRERADEAQRSLDAVNNVFFADNQAEVK